MERRGAPSSAALRPGASHGYAAPDQLQLAERLHMTETELFDLLNRLQISFQTHRHPPLHTVEESRKLRGDLPGAHIKNMFLKGKKGDLWLITCLEDRSVRMRTLEKAIGASRLSFGKPELMQETIGVSPGAVTPLAVVNDGSRQISVVLDAALANADIVNCHPLHNEATLCVSGRLADGDGLAKLFAHSGHDPVLIDFDALAESGDGGK